MPATADMTTATGAVSGAVSTLSAVSDMAVVTAVVAEAVALITLSAVEVDPADVDADATGGLGEVLTFLRFFNNPTEAHLRTTL